MKHRRLLRYSIKSIAKINALCYNEKVANDKKLTIIAKHKNNCLSNGGKR